MAKKRNLLLISGKHAVEKNFYSKDIDFSLAKIYDLPGSTIDFNQFDAIIIHYEDEYKKQVIALSRGQVFHNKLLLITSFSLIEDTIQLQLYSSKITDILYITPNKDLNTIKLYKSINHFKQLHPEIKDREYNKLQALLNALTDIVFFKNTESIYIDCNELFCTSVKKTREEIIGATDHELFEHDIAKNFIKNDRYIFESKKPYEQEEWISYPGRGKVLMETLKMPVYDKNKQVAGILGISRDITERKKAQKALISSEQKYKILADNMSDIIWVFDIQNNKFSYISPSIKDLTGYEVRQVMNKNLGDIITENSLSVLNHRIENLTKNKPKELSIDDRKVILQYKHKHGDLFWAECVINKIKDPKNKHYEILAVSRDISKRIETETQLKEKELQLKESQHLAEIASLEYNLEGQKLQLSDNFFDVLGIIDYELQEQFSMKKLFEYIHPDDKMEFIHNLKAIFTKLQNIEYTYRIIDSNEVTRNISSFTKFRFNEELQPVTFICTFQNVTNQKINEKLKRNVELARKAADMREQFLANMSHEIRTPMTGIMGMIDFLLKSKLDDKQKDYALTIKNSSESMLNIINDILLVSKIDAGKLEIKPATFHVSKAIEDAKKLFQPLIRQKKLNLITEISDEIPIYITADQNRVKQVMTNLLSNAVKFTDKGSITIHVSKTWQENKNINIKIEIIDTGIGISKTNQKKLFTKFSQVDSSFTRNQEGLGLGLTISKELVELMNGEIGVDSKENEGSNFWFTFNAVISDKIPIAKKTKQEKKEANKKLNKKILFAEDKFVNQKVVTLMLENAGCSVVTAKNGQEAIEYFSKDTYDLILMDIQMPVMDGITAVKKLREQFDNVPPVIAISANAMEGDAQRFINLGMDDYIAKPVKEKVLHEKISWWLKKHNKKKLIIHNNLDTMSEKKEFNSYPVINEETISSINEQSGGDKDFLKMLFDSFFEDANELTEEIDTALKENDHKKLKEAVHSLKGLAGTIGASRLHEICKEIDKNLKSDENKQAKEMLPHLKENYKLFKETAEKNYLQ